jgi:DMSO/TMAO reductase YedYZ heme-binding membrane subunit
MVKLLIDFIQFIYALAPLLVALGVLTLLAVLLSKSIKRHAMVYYIVFAIPFAMVAIPFIGRLTGIEMFSFGRIPFLGGIIRDYIHAGTLSFPLLIIIMYMGALNPKFTWVKKLMSIRKELSIISGFPVFAHSLIRVSNNFPQSLKYFTSHGEYMETARVTNEAGAWISNFSFVLGIVLLILFIPLWLTSFDSVRKRMGGIRWKKLQKWSYVLYALLFIHAAGIQVGGLLNPRGGRPAQVENVQATGNNRTEAENIRNQTEAGNSEAQANPERRGRGREAAGSNVRNVQPEVGRSDNAGVSTAPGRGGHGQSTGFADIKTSPQARQYIHIISLVLIFGSYLYLRLRKARTGRKKIPTV